MQKSVLAPGGEILNEKLKCFHPGVLLIFYLKNQRKLLYCNTTFRESKKPVAVARDDK